MRECEPHHADIGANVIMKDEFMKSFPHSSFHHGQVLKVSGDLRYVKFRERRAPLWLNRALIDYAP
ncbi:MAG: hypothetical protein APF80_09250 [Alphaproteobacteria bacterium BRH_c36]|nr:MAG: hypothetical protein APF80_09250 [Alphaproteobacteria bacterium BRH_c36]